MDDFDEAGWPFVSITSSIGWFFLGDNFLVAFMFLGIFDGWMIGSILDSGFWYCGEFFVTYESPRRVAVFPWHSISRILVSNDIASNEGTNDNLFSVDGFDPASGLCWFLCTESGELLPITLAGEVLVSREFYFCIPRQQWSGLFLSESFRLVFDFSQLSLHFFL